MLSCAFAAETPNYQFQKIPPGSTNYPVLMDNFMDDVDAAIWGRQQENTQQDTEIGDRLVIDDAAPGVPTCITPTTGVDIDQSGKAFTWINVSWSGVLDTDLREYEIRGKKGASGEYFYSYTNQVSVNFAPAMAGESYYFNVRSIDKQGNVSGYCAEQVILASKDTSAPAIPTGLGLTTGLDLDNNGVTYVWVQSDWTANTEKDVVSYKLRIKEGVGGTYYYSTTTTNTLRFVGLKQGVTYYVGVQAIDASKNESGYTADVSMSSAADTTPPGLVTGLAATSTFKSMWLTWVNPSDTDFDSAEIWRSATNDSATAAKVGESPGVTYNDSNLSIGQTFYYWAKSRDWSGNTSGLDPPQYSGVTATTGSIGTTDITSFAVNASKIYTRIPILESDSWANNSPSAGYVSWGAHTLYYNGSAYSITAGNSNQKYIYWSGLGTAYAGAATLNDGVGPTLNDYEFIIATNVDGSHDLAWNAIANQVIGSAFILNAAITNAKIANLAVDNAKISDLSAIKINAGSLQSTNWSGAAGSQLNISDGTFYIGGSTNPKLSWNGTTLTVKGSVSVESGQAFSCTDCVDGTAVQFAYATSSSEGGNASNTDSVGSQAASAVNTGVSRATTGLNLLGQTIQLVDSTNLPPISSGTSKVVIGSSGIKMFNDSSAERVNINTDGTFRFGNSAGDNLYWNGSTLVLTGRATIATSADSATTATSATTASSANDLSCTDCVADTELNSIIDLGAGGVTVRSNNANNKVQMSSSGLYGYNTSSAKTFEIDASTGNAYFGPAGNQIAWDGSVLTVPAANVTGTLTGNHIQSGSLASSSYVSKGAILINATSGSETTITVSSTADFGASGNGFFVDSTNDNDAFSWTGKTATTLTGCSGVLAHNARAIVRLYAKTVILSGTNNEIRVYNNGSDLVASVGYDFTSGDVTSVFGNASQSGEVTSRRSGGIFTATGDAYYGSLMRASYGVITEATYGIGGSFYGGTGNITLPVTSYSLSGIMANPTSNLYAPQNTIVSTNTGALVYKRGSEAWAQLAFGVFGSVTGSTSPSVKRGTGFSVSRTAIGNFTVTFNSPFAVAPVVLATMEYNDSSIIRVDTVGTGSFKVYMQSYNGTGYDHDFNFMAIVP